MKHQPCIIIGGGGHTRVLIGMLQQLGWPIAGIVTADRALLGSAVLGVPVLGIDGAHAIALGTLLVNGVGNRASRQESGLAVRAAIHERYVAQGFQFASAISPSAIVQPHVGLGEGVQIMPGAILQPGAQVGDNAILNSGAIIEHDVRIGAHAHVAPGAVLCGGAHIGTRTHIGAGAVVLQGVTVGADAVIAAGAIVARNVEDGAIVTL